MATSPPCFFFSNNDKNKQNVVVLNHKVLNYKKKSKMLNFICNNLHVKYGQGRSVPSVGGGGEAHGRQQLGGAK